MMSTERGSRVATYTSLVPAQLAKLLDADDPAVTAALGSFEAVLVGGQAMAPSLRERAESAGVRVVRTYGATETSGGCVYDGRALDQVGVRVVDGEVQLSGPTLAEGYLDDEAATDAAFPRDAHGVRWYRTGDAGILEDGVLRVRGRLDNVIVSGGINVSLDRVEEIVRAVPGLESAVVVGVPDARWGEASVVVVARGEGLRRSEAVQLGEARTAVEARIGPHARPARLVLVDELATLPSGKPDRESIRSVVAALRS
jgi:O-succinylbenzoic acid--CoA ligase